MREKQAHSRKLREGLGNDGEELGKGEREGEEGDFPTSPFVLKECVLYNTGTGIRPLKHASPYFIEIQGGH